MEENKEHKTHEHNTEHKEHKEHEHHERKKEHEHHVEHKKEHEHKEHKEHEHPKEHEKHKEHHAHHKPAHHMVKKKPQVSGLTFILGVVVFALVVYNSFQIAAVDSILKQAEIDAIEAARPAEIQLTVINVNYCEDCFDVSSFADSLASSKVVVTETTVIESSSDEAKALIDKHGIVKLPTVIISGEIDKEKTLGNKLKGKTKESDGEYIFTALTPPYIDAATGDVAGTVSVVELTTTACTTCFNVSLIRDQIELMGVTFGSVEEVDANSAKGQDMIAEYKIDRVPALLFDKQLTLYPEVTQAWSQIGTIEEDGTYVTRTTNPPFYDLTDKTVKGLVTMTVLSDETCEECYDGLEMHEQIMMRMGVFVAEVNEHDSSSEEGALLMEQYEIEKLPTILLTGDVAEYTYLTGSWAQVGTVEDDGTYVFRLVEFANQPYLNVSTGSVIAMMQLE